MLTKGLLHDPCHYLLGWYYSGPRRECCPLVLSGKTDGMEAFPILSSPDFHLSSSGYFLQYRDHSPQV